MVGLGRVVRIIRVFYLIEGCRFSRGRSVGVDPSAVGRWWAEEEEEEREKSALSEGR